MALTFLPNAGQSLGVTRAAIRQNFVDINNQFALDHVVFNSANNGFHQKLTMVSNAVAPTFVAPQIGIFNSVVNGAQQLSLARGAAAAYTFTEVQSALPGWTRLPSGVIMKWGQITGTGNTTVLYPTGAGQPAFTNVFTVQFQVIALFDPQITVTLHNYTLPALVDRFTCFISNTVTTNAATGTFTYLAIGI